MIDTTTRLEARQLKKEKDAAYLVFKKHPSVENANIWSAASRAYDDFCIKTITDLITDEDSSKEEVLANFDKYKTCKTCGTELLYLSGVNNYVAGVNFVEDFPGWCYDCLVEYCTSHKCEGCTVSSRPLNCSFAEVKKLKEKEQ